MNEIEEICSELEVISKLSDQDRSDLSGLAVERGYLQQEIIAHHGEVWPCLLVLREGLINVTKSSAQGRMLGAMRLQAGDSFWSPSLLDGRPLPASLEVKEQCSVVLWQREDVLPLIRNNPEALWELVQVLSRRIRQASGYIEELSFQPLAGRLARLIVNLAETSGEQQFSRSMTLEEMAANTGTTAVMVCKLLSRFADAGLIKVSRTDFELTDKDQLEDMAKASN
jgi:CRP-like cAMP-binding protein